MIIQNHLLKNTKHIKKTIILHNNTTIKNKKNNKQNLPSHTIHKKLTLYHNNIN